MVEPSDIFFKNYKGKRVLVTGHTGFKGSWLSLWLLELGAKVAGFSKYLPSQPCAFEVMGLARRLQDFKGDVRNYDEIKNVFNEFKPQIVFHLAAQPIVRESYNDPKLTFDTNLGGTINVLECIKASSSVESAVFITSDKCYENVNWEWGYREIDRLGGEDPYSASKACAEIAFHSYFKSFFQNHKTKIATARAGNVIGGGDWAKDRIVPDCISAWNKKNIPVIRKPEATRPWQHVLEPISGYLLLGALLSQGNHNHQINGEAFNFGPGADVVKSVGELVETLIGYSGKGEWKHEPMRDEKKEAILLKLDCDKALNRLQWKSLLSFDETVELTSNWYKQYYEKNLDLYEFSLSQIEFYVEKGFKQKLPWVVGRK
ncbi:MAG: CDP-glucose 4,6-dehydratase [Candidatus Omnitrophica bacterium]|nr:CDP-glucose 4,6-dehydratase [Candidatus Omnitrophota bacterium]